MINTSQSLMVTSNVSQAFKLSALMLSAGVATFSLFAAMSKLIEDEKSFQADPSAPILVTIANVKDDSATNEIQKALPPPPVVKPIPRPSMELTDDIGDEGLAGPADWDFSTKVSIGNGVPSGGLKNVSALPVVRVPPKYPKKAALEGIEGWVKLAFSVNEIGHVINARVVDAEPKRVFDSAARKALKKWKYKPKMVDGTAVVQNDQFVVLEFNMDKS